MFLAATHSHNLTLSWRLPSHSCSKVLKTPCFLKLNPRGMVPILVDGYARGCRGCRGPQLQYASHSLFSFVRTCVCVCVCSDTVMHESLAILMYLEYRFAAVSAHSVMAGGAAVLPRSHTAFAWGCRHRCCPKHHKRLLGRCVTCKKQTMFHQQLARYTFKQLVLSTHLIVRFVLTVHSLCVCTGYLLLAPHRATRHQRRVPVCQARSSPQGVSCTSRLLLSNLLVRICSDINVFACACVRLSVSLLSLSFA